MSKKEETTNTRISPRALQKKLSVISKQRSAQEGSVDSKKIRGNSTDDLNHTKVSRYERSVSIDDRQFYERYTDIINQMSEFYDLFKRYAITEDIKDKLDGIINDDNEEEPLHMLKCMNYIMEMLVEGKQADKPKSGSFQSGAVNNDYEELLQKAENDIRQHIRIEQQMKLLIDGLQAKVDEYEKDNPSEDDEKGGVKQRVDPTQLLDMVRQKEEEITNLQKTLKQKDDMIKGFEEKLVSVAILEHTIKSQKESHKKDKENIRNYYEQELASVTKEIQHIQRILAINLTSEDKVKLLQEELLSSNDFNIKKVQLLENRMRQLTEANPLDKDEPEPAMLYTDPGFDDRRYSVRPSATTASIMKSRGYDLKSHRASTDMHNKNSENRPQTKQSPPKKKKDIINELKSTTILGARFLGKNNVKEQPQQGPAKSQKECENYLNYLKRKMDNLPQNEKEREHLRSFDARRSNSVKRGVYLAGQAGIPKEKSVDKTMRMDMSRTQDGSESLGDKHTKSVPKLMKSAANTMYAKVLKH